MNHHIPLCHASPPGSVHLSRWGGSQWLGGRVTILLVIPTHLFRLTSLMQCQNVMSAHHVSGRPDLRGPQITWHWSYWRLGAMFVAHGILFKNFILLLLEWHKLSKIILCYVFNDPPLACKHFGGKHYKLYGFCYEIFLLEQKQESNFPIQLLKNTGPLKMNSMCLSVHMV